MVIVGAGAVVTAKTTRDAFHVILLVVPAVAKEITKPPLSITLTVPPATTEMSIYAPSATPPLMKLIIDVPALKFLKALPFQNPMFAASNI